VIIPNVFFSGYNDALLTISHKVNTFLLLVMTLFNAASWLRVLHLEDKCFYVRGYLFRHQAPDASLKIVQNM
jgi:hypothetical protein